MCLPVCPTYQLTGLERSSPRGRIRLIKEVSENKLPMTDLFVDEMNFCLDCQACQTVCPAGVKYGQLVEAARAEIFEAGRDRQAVLKKFFFRFIFASPKRIKVLSRILRFHQNYLAGILSAILPVKLATLQRMSPRISRQFSDEILPERTPATGHARYKVGILTGCLMNVMYSEINLDTANVLRSNNCEVITPAGQGCCGSLPAHNGDFRIARKYARDLIDAFGQFDLDAVVVNSAGCSAFLKEYSALLSGDPDYSAKAVHFVSLIRDVSEFLVEIDFRKPETAITGTATYHEACHLVHSQGISEQPRLILQSIPGIEFVEMNESSWCCGSAGIYNIVRNSDSLRILERKIDNIVESGAEMVVTGNPGCLGQIAFGLKDRGLNIEVIHPVTLLNRAYGNSQQ